MQPQELKNRALAVGLTWKVWVKLASERGSIIYPTQMSNWFSGYTLPVEKQERLLAVLESVEDLARSSAAKIDLRDAENVKVALAKLAEIRAAKKDEENPATAVAPWHRGAVAEADDDLSSASSVTEILSGATND